MLVLYILAGYLFMCILQIWFIYLFEDEEKKRKFEPEDYIGASLCWPFIFAFVVVFLALVCFFYIIQFFLPGPNRSFKELLNL